MILINDCDDWVTITNTNVTPSEVLYEGHGPSSRDIAYLLRDLGHQTELQFDGVKESL